MASAQLTKMLGATLRSSPIFTQVSSRSSSLITSSLTLPRSTLHFSNSVSLLSSSCSPSSSSSCSASASASSPLLLIRCFSSECPSPSPSTPSATETVTVTFVKGDDRKVVQAAVGASILEIAHKNDVDLEGACEGSLACSTCHVILDKEFYDRLPEPTDSENDMLDLAFGLTDTSRLGCQIILNKDLEGMVLRLPAATRNMAVDGYKPPKH